MDMVGEVMTGMIEFFGKDARRIHHFLKVYGFARAIALAEGVEVNALRVIDLLRGRGVTVMVATHDLSGVTRIMDKVLLLHHRATGFGRPDEVLTPANLAAAFGGPVPAAGMVS